MKKNKIATLGLLTLCTMFMFTGCGSFTGETPAAGVSIQGAENQILGFTYLYDLGNGYKLYADNFTKIVYLRYDYSAGSGATSVGSSSMTPYISTNGNYYKVNTQTRVIEEFIPMNTQTNNNVVITDENTEIENQEQQTESTESNENTQSSSQQQTIEDILNENSQKNTNTNNQQKLEHGDIPIDNDTEVDENSTGAIEDVESTEVQEENIEE